MMRKNIKELTVGRFCNEARLGSILTISFSKILWWTGGIDILWDSQGLRLLFE